MNKIYNKNDLLAELDNFELHQILAKATKLGTARIAQLAQECSQHINF